MKHKEKVMYRQFQSQREWKRTPGTVAWVIEKYIREMNGLDTGRPIRMLGLSHVYSLTRLQRSPILGGVMARDLTKHHVIEHCKHRRETVCPATTNTDVTYLSGALQYAPSAWSDCEDVSAAAVTAAKPFLKKHNLIGKSTPRTRVPHSSEIETLIEYFAKPPKKRVKGYIHAMPDMILFALGMSSDQPGSSRRVGEICRINHLEIDWDHKDESGQSAPMYLVRDMKHPTQKKDNNKWFPLFPWMAEIVKRQPSYAAFMDMVAEFGMDWVKMLGKEGIADCRVFPFSAKSVSAKYTIAKKHLGIVDLRFHDNRRGAITSWLKKFTPHQVRHIASGHKNTVILERVYDATDPAGGHELVRRLMAPAEQRQ